MKIAFITYEYPPFLIGGAGIYAKHITQELADLGHDVTVFTPDIVDNNENYDNEKQNLKIIKINVNKKIPYNLLQFWFKLPEIIKSQDQMRKFDVIHVNGLSYWYIKKLLDVPHVLTVHHTNKDAIKFNQLNFISRIKDIGGENSIIMSIIEKRSIENTDFIIAVSNFTKNQIVKYYNIKPDKIGVVHNGIDLDNFSFSNKELNKTRDLLKLPDKPVILFVGRVDDPRKGLVYLLNAFKMLTEKQEAVLLLVGSGEQDNIKKMAESLGISKNLVLAGFLDDETLRKCYHICDVYACPSLLEGFGLTVLEAMAAGSTIVATDTGSIPEVLEKYENKILVEPKNSESLADSLLNSLNSKSVTNKNTSLNKFTWERSARTLSKFLEKSCGKN